MKICTSSVCIFIEVYVKFRSIQTICIFIEVYVKFRSIQTKSLFIFDFLIESCKIAIFFEVRLRKCDLEVEFFQDFFHSCLRQKNNISHKKFEFFDKGRIKYEFLTRLKLNTPKHQPRS